MDNKTHHLTKATCPKWIFRVAMVVWIGLLVVANTFAAPSRPQTKSARFIPGRILVKPRDGVSENALANKFIRHAGRQHSPLHRTKIRAVDVTEANVESFLTELRRDPTIEFAERDYLAEAAFLPNDSYVVADKMWHLDKIKAPLAWNITFGESDVVVAVLDSGINAAHPDFIGRTLAGYDFVWGDADPADDFGHGTAVAGVIAAAGNNGIGVAGVAFGSRILPVKVMDASGYAAYSILAQGIRYAVDQGARVINISIAGSAPSATLQDAINYAWNNNVVVVAAAGNNGNSTPQYPAACEHVVAVSATQPDDTLAGFSSTGSHLDIAAPGENIYTTTRDLNTPYGAWRGTSLASPVIAATAALVASANPLLRNAQIVEMLEQTADDLGAAGRDSLFGNGRVNAARAVSLASGIPLEDEPSNVPPTVSIVNPANNSGFILGTSVYVGISAASSVTNVHLLANGNLVATLGTPPFAATWQPATIGDFSLTVVALDRNGLSATSAPVLVHIAGNPPPTTASLSLSVAGSGTIRRSFPNNLLVVGQNYTVIARPGLGHVFAGWEGMGTLNLNPTLTFTMKPGLALVANFVPTPFVPLKGSYNGLVWNTNSVTPETSGAFTLSMTSSGAFSCRVLVGGKRYAARGQFDITGAATVTIARRQASPLIVSLQADLQNGTDQVYGTVNEGGWVASLAGDRHVFSSKNPAPQAGRREFLLEHTDPSGTAASGLSRIARTGRALVGGILQDGRKFAVVNALARNGDYPLYLPLSGGGEVVIGWLNFPANASGAAAGTMAWVKSGTNTFAATLQATAKQK